MNRRAILKALGMGAAAPVAAPALSLAHAASAVGATTAVNDPTIGEACGTVGYANPRYRMIGRMQDQYYRSQEIESRVTHGHAYPHMKSWGRGFRLSCMEQDERLLREFMDRLGDERFAEKFFASIGIELPKIEDDLS